MLTDLNDRLNWYIAVEGTDQEQRAREDVLIELFRIINS